MDTTVILAQPRVSRLRADVVYVDASGEPVPYYVANFPALLTPQKLSLPQGSLEKKDPYSKNDGDPSGAQPFYGIFFSYCILKGTTPHGHDHSLGGTPPIHKRELCCHCSSK